MAAIYEEALKKAISGGKSNVYVIYGDDGFLKKMYVDKIIAKITTPDDIFNFQRFSSDCDLQEIYDFAMQIPMMADKKCVVLCDYDFEHCSKSELDMLCQLLSEIPDTAVLILWFDSLDFDHKKSSKFKKITAAAEKNAGTVAVLNHRRVPELVKMLCDGAAKRGCKLEPSVARYLVESAGEDINILKNELDKLCAFAATGTVTSQTVDEVCIKSVEAEIYSLSKQIIDCNTSAAMKTLDELFFTRLEPIIILSTVSSAYVDMYRVLVCRKRGMNINQISEQFGYKGKEFVLERAGDNLKKLDFKKLRLSFEALCDADRSLKSFGADARTVLEQLIIRLIYIIAKGERVDKA